MQRRELHTEYAMLVAKVIKTELLVVQPMVAL
jgi:hypothetical protein